MKLFLVGRYKSGRWPKVAWEFQGIFSAMSKATEACRDDTYFVVTVTLDESLPHESIRRPTLYPKTGVTVE